MSDETTRAALEAAIDAHPDQASNYLVLADWLQEHQDPRGELIVRWRQTDAVSKADRAVRQHKLGPKPPKFGGWRWFYGFVQEFRTIIDADDTQWTREFLDHPSLRHVAALDFQLGGDQWDERQWLIDLIAERPRPSWRDLTINSYWRGGNDPPCGELDLSPLGTVLPRLTKLRVSGRDLLLPKPLVSETLSTLILDGAVNQVDLQPLLELSAPNLRELELVDANRSTVDLLVKSPLAAKLEKLKVPYQPDQAALREVLPHVTFHPAPSGDRYEQIGE